MLATTLLQWKICKATNLPARTVPASISIRRPRPARSSTLLSKHRPPTERRGINSGGYHLLNFCRHFIKYKLHRTITAPVELD